MKPVCFRGENKSEREKEREMPGTKVHQQQKVMSGLCFKPLKDQFTFPRNLKIQGVRGSPSKWIQGPFIADNQMPPLQLVYA